MIVYRLSMTMKNKGRETEEKDVCLKRENGLIFIDKLKVKRRKLIGKKAYFQVVDERVYTLSPKHNPPQPVQKIYQIIGGKLKQETAR